MIPIEQKAPPGDRTAAEWNHVAYATRRRRRILLRRILSYPLFMIGFVFHNPIAPVQLLQQYHPHELMGESHT